jgi:hypothetical protein
LTLPVFQHVAVLNADVGTHRSQADRVVVGPPLPGMIRGIPQAISPTRISSASRSDTSAAGAAPARRARQPRLGRATAVARRGDRRAIASSGNRLLWQSPPLYVRSASAGVLTADRCLRPRGLR